MRFRKTFLLLAAVSAAAQPTRSFRDKQADITAAVLPPGLRDVGLDQKLNAQAPLYLEFRDEDGHQAPLSQFFGRKPMILALVYYQCPMLCTQILNGLVRSLRGMSLESGRDFEVVSVSIDPTETPKLAKRKRDEYLRRYTKSATGWHFLTGSEAQIKGLARAVGFRYAYDPRTRQFAHASAIMVLTPEGRLSRYFYGIEYAPRDLRLGLVEASQNKIGTPVDQLLLFCYHYDPKTGKYSAVVMNIVRLGAALTLAGLAALLFVLWRHELRRRTQKPAPGMLRAR